MTVNNACVSYYTIGMYREYLKRSVACRYYSVITCATALCSLPELNHQFVRETLVYPLKD